MSWTKILDTIESGMKIASQATTLFARPLLGFCSDIAMYQALPSLCESNFYRSSAINYTRFSPSLMVWEIRFKVSVAKLVLVCALCMLWKNVGDPVSRVLSRGGGGGGSFLPPPPPPHPKRSSFPPKRF